MNSMTSNHFSQSVYHFHGRHTPEASGWLAGYSALIQAYDLKVPLPERLCFISSKHRRYTKADWDVYTLRHKPEETLQGHLTFALKYEGVQLHILRALFLKITPDSLEQWLKSEPVGRYSRRIWFLYEWLTEKQLNIADARTGNFVDALDAQLQFPGPSLPSKRHRVNDNLPGNRNFCPLVWRTETLQNFIDLDLKSLARQRTGAIHPDVLQRAAAFLLLKDSRASFAIEGETPQKGRAERWGRAIAQAGLHPLSLEELNRLQKIVIEDQRFIKLGLRQEGGFIGVHERSTHLPLPDHISARWEDLPCLMEGLIETYHTLYQSQTLDPVIVATAIAFGFVFIHPLTDGNGRLHRYLIHHVLAEMGFSQKGIVFPISAVILRYIEQYRQVLESYSRPRLEFIEWRATLEGNLEVLNETIDLYRYFDATKMAEFLYDCVVETVEKVLPEEINYLARYDRLKSSINELLDMPDYLADLLISFLEQNQGTLSKRARAKEFKDLTEQEVLHLESLYKDLIS